MYSGLDTAVISIDGFVRADRGIPFQGFLLIDEDLDILAQGSLTVSYTHLTLPTILRV